MNHSIILIKTIEIKSFVKNKQNITLKHYSQPTFYLKKVFQNQQNPKTGNVITTYRVPSINIQGLNTPQLTDDTAFE